MACNTTCEQQCSYQCSPAAQALPPHLWMEPSAAGVHSKRATVQLQQSRQHRGPQVGGGASLLLHLAAAAHGCREQGEQGGRQRCYQCLSGASSCHSSRQVYAQAVQAAAVHIQGQELYASQCTLGEMLRHCCRRQPQHQGHLAGRQLLHGRRQCAPELAAVQHCCRR
jgi:hypothetical protein